MSGSRTLSFRVVRRGALALTAVFWPRSQLFQQTHNMGRRLGPTLITMTIMAAIPHRQVLRAMKGRRALTTRTAVMRHRAASRSRMYGAALRDSVFILSRNRAARTIFSLQKPRTQMALPIEWYSTRTAAT